MVSVSGVQVHVLRLTIAVALILIIFLFFDPIGFASESLTNFMTPGSTHVVTHLVLFHFSKSADPAAVRQACTRMLALKDECLAPNSQHPYIKSISGGKDMSTEGLQDGLTHAFVVQFENHNDRDYYVQHDPVHKAFKKEIEPIIEKVTVLDFINGEF